MTIHVSKFLFGYCSAYSLDAAILKVIAVDNVTVMLHCPKLPF